MTGRMLGVVSRDGASWSARSSTSARTTRRPSRDRRPRRPAQRLRGAHRRSTGGRRCRPRATSLLALTGRVGAVASIVQWEAEPGPDAVTPELRDELADCLVYLCALADALDVDVVDDAVTRIRGAVEASTR